MGKLFSYDLSAFRVVGDTGTDIPPGRALSIVTPPTEPPAVSLCPAGAWPWAVSWYNPDIVPPNITPTQDGSAIAFNEPNIYVAVDSALAKDTYLKVTNDGQFGDADGDVACCQLLETTSGAGLAWATTVIGRLRNGDNATITTSDPGPYTSLSTIAEMTISDLEIRTGAALVIGFCAFDFQHLDDFRLWCYVDGVPKAKSRRYKWFGGSLLGLTPASQIDSKEFKFLIRPLSAGPHDFEIKVEADTGSAKPSLTDRELQVIEI